MKEKRYVKLRDNLLFDDRIPMEKKLAFFIEKEKEGLEYKLAEFADYYMNGGLENGDVIDFYLTAEELQPARTGALNYLMFLIDKLDKFMKEHPMPEIPKAGRTYEKPKIGEKPADVMTGHADAEPLTVPDCGDKGFFIVPEVAEDGD